jgi:glycolate oxidase FAD binding subunit
VLDAPTALARCRTWARTAYPITAACHHDGVLRIRLSGTEPAIAWAAAELGGDSDPEADFWTALRDHRLEFFRAGAPLWRASLPPAARAPLDDCLVNWGGAERWWRPTGAAAVTESFVDEARGAGGSAIRFDGLFGALGNRALPGDYAARLKSAFDPRNILNPHLSPGYSHHAH